jgi:peptidoglycan/xylan/chitin deacetylase (PgdA/CDA1 family)
MMKAVMYHYVRNADPQFPYFSHLPLENFTRQVQYLAETFQLLGKDEFLESVASGRPRQGVVLTFDDGPWPGNTRMVLDALAQHCVKATFFPIGKHALWHPEILKEVAAAGHTIGGHTWSHANLGKLKDDKATEEIEKGFSAVKLALGAPPAPFFRFPYLQDPKDQLAYLGSRNIAIVSHDLDSFDFKMRKPEDVIKSVMTKLERKGKGIILMHDFQRTTAKAMPDLLNELKAKGYKIVHMKAKMPVTTLAQWDAAAKNEVKGVAVGTVPTNSVVRTVEDAVIALPAKGPQTK